MTSQLGEQAIAKHILTNILRSKGNQAMKLGFLKNHTKNPVEILFPDSFLKKSKLSISLAQ